MTKILIAILAAGVLMVGASHRMDAAADTAPERLRSVPVWLIGLVLAAIGIAGLALLSLLE